MVIPFVNRSRELTRLSRAIASPTPAFIVVYGRRRCGKSRLLAELPGKDLVYYLADMQESPLQLRALAEQIAARIPGFDSVEYPSWESILRQFQRQCRREMTLVIDEFPHLVRMYPPLASVVQKIVDGGLEGNLVLCGSSQRMMQGLVLDAAAPLYGRATEILRIDPLMPGWICDGLGLSGVLAFESYAVWGGVPRYWESARDHDGLQQALRYLVFDKNGVFHSEPARLLMDDVPGSTQPNSLLALIGAGCHRLSEIAARLGKPAVNLSKPLSQLVELAYIRRDLPFGESLRSTKRSYYHIADPFLRFWYRYVNPNRSVLELGLIDQVYDECMRSFSAHVGGVWEDCARMSTAFVRIDGIQWKPASRWWGAGTDRRPCEIDIVAESFDGAHLLLGEAKWEHRVDPAAVLQRLMRNAERVPFVNGRTIHYALWLKNPPLSTPAKCTLLDPATVLSHLRG
ncbi:MAG: AAA family ATPase [Chitinivibrionales bacterium]|nr:AAA family ATPase [Chitinivibrionales bacterium]